MPTRLCLEPGCPSVATQRGRCPTHSSERNVETRSANRPIYNTKRWRMTRRSFLFSNPLCSKCGVVATDVHHRIDLQQGGDPWRFDNLEALCHRCHSRITRRRQATT